MSIDYNYLLNIADNILVKENINIDASIKNYLIILANNSINNLINNIEKIILLYNNFESLTDVKELDIDLLKTGNYTSINRFDRPIVKVEKVGAKINPSRTACMLKVSTYDLHKNYSLIDNCIYLSPIKNK